MNSLPTRRRRRRRQKRKKNENHLEEKILGGPMLSMTGGTRKADTKERSTGPLTQHVGTKLAQKIVVLLKLLFVE